MKGKAQGPGFTKHIDLQVPFHAVGSEIQTLKGEILDNVGYATLFKHDLHRDKSGRGRLDGSTSDINNSSKASNVTSSRQHP